MNRMSVRSLTKSFLVFFIPLAILTGGILGFLYHNENEDRKSAIRQKEINRLTTLKEVITTYIRAIALDVLVVSKHDELRKLVETGSVQHFSALASEFVWFCKIKGIYDQVRLLDNTGMEILRVNYDNGNPNITPKEDLQFKGERYYFKEAAQLSENEIFVSPFDLNVEHGKIEVPVKPMIRLGTPVVDRSGSKKGILLLNYLGADLLKIIDKVSEKGGGKSILLNADGYYLRGLNPDDEWGFMHGDKKDSTFALHYPNSWEKIKDSETGQFFNDEGLFTHLTIKPFSEVQVSGIGSGNRYEASKGLLKGSQYHWNVVSYIDPESLGEADRQLFTKILMLYILMLAFMAIGSGVIAYAREKRRVAEKEISSHRDSLKLLVEQRTSELTQVNEQLRNDIKERRRAENALSASDSYMRSIFRAAPIGIGVVKDRVFNQVNDRFCDMLGYSVEELIKQPSILIYPSVDEYEKVGKVKYDQIRQRGTGTVETQFKTKDGKIIDVLLSSTPINTDDLSVGVTFTALDITEQKQAAAALRENEEKYRSITETMEDSIFICSSDYEVEFMNRAMVEQVGHDATGELCYKALHKYENPCPWCVHDRVMQGETISSEIHVHEDRKFYHVANTPIAHQDGRISKLSVYRDVTGIKNMEKQLRQTQKLEAIGTLAGGIAHDFNNILSGIFGYSQLAEINLDDPVKSKRYIGEIVTGAQRASALVQQILTFSRQAEDKKAPMTASITIKEALKLLRATIPSNIKIRENIFSKSYVMADPTRIHQIVMNLCTNAYHAMRNTGGVLSVSLEEVNIPDEDSVPEINKHPGQYIKLEVSDTGSGIEDKILERIFDPYFTTKKVGEGTGMGLALVQAIVDEHNGFLEVDTELKKGTNFYIYLPVIEQECKVGNTPVKNDLSLLKGDEKIMFVDDERQIRMIFKEYFENRGYEVHIFENALTALEKFEEDPDYFDMVITDMTMPDMTGDIFAAKILEIREGLPVVICTGYSERISEAEALRLGIKKYIEKPFDSSELAKSIRQIFDAESV